MFRNLQFSTKRKSRVSVLSPKTSLELPTSESKGIEGVTMRRRLSDEDSFPSTKMTPRKRSSADTQLEHGGSSTKCAASGDHTHSLTDIPLTCKRSSFKYDVERGNKGLSCTPKRNLKQNRPSHLDLGQDSFSNPTADSSSESPAFKNSDIFLFRNAFNMDEEIKLPRIRSLSESVNCKERVISSKKEIFSLRNSDSVTETYDEYEKDFESIVDTMKKSTDDLLTLISSKNSMIDDECFLFIDDTNINYGREETDFPLQMFSKTQRRRTQSLSGDTTHEGPNKHRDKTTSYDVTEEFRKGCVSLDTPALSPSKKVRTITFGRYSIKEPKKRKSFRRSLSECEQKSNLKKHERTESLKKKLMRYKQSAKAKDGSFFKGILRKNKKEAVRSYSDGSDKGSSPWHSRRQGGSTQQGFEGGGSAPTSPQTGTKLPKLHFWKRGPKQGKPQNENASDSIVDKEESSPIHSVSPVQSFSSPLHSRDLNLQGQLRRNRQLLQQQQQQSKDGNRDETLRKENSLKIRIQEAKGIPDKRSYYCVLIINDREVRETTLKYKDGICFWGEVFELFDLEEVRTIGILLLREDNKKIGLAEFQPVPSIQNPKLDEWVKVALEKSSKDKDDIAIRIRYTFRKVTILPLVEYKRFTKYLRDSSLNVCKKLETLLNVKAKEDFMSSLMNVLQYNDRAVSFLNQLIILDVKKTGDNDKVLFRANSMATKAVEVYMKLVGEYYLEATLLGPVTHLIHTTKELEVDCSKLSGDFLPLVERQKNLLEAVEDVWSSILRSPLYFPREIQEVFFAVRETLQNDESTDRLISASVFLRLLCPAVLSPHLFGLMKEYPEPAANRRLTLVAKTLQTLANFSTFQSKEDCMQFLNPFIEREAANCRQFLANISGPRPPETNGERKFPKEHIYPGRHLALLHLHLKDFLATTDLQSADAEVSRLLCQLNHIDDCLKRYEQQEREKDTKQQEIMTKISSPFLYRSPPVFRRSVSENPSKLSSFKRSDDLSLKPMDYNRPLYGNTPRGVMPTQDPPCNSFTSRKNAAPDLSTSDNYVLQSALINRRDSGSSNMNILNNNNNNNNIESSNLNHNNDTVTKDSNSTFNLETYPELNNQSQDHRTMTSRSDAKSNLTPKLRTREKTLST